MTPKKPSFLLEWYTKSKGKSRKTKEAGKEEQMREPAPFCETCKHMPWTCLPFEDEPAHPHYSSLEALITSTKKCRMCVFILYAAVSNYRRSRAPPQESYHWWTRYETIHTTQAVHSNALRRAAYIKALGPAIPDMETDVLVGERGGYFTHKMIQLWDTERQFHRPTFLYVPGMVEAHDVEPIEDSVISLDELRSQVPKNMGVWVYANYWRAPEAKNEIAIDNWHLMGIGARFGVSGHMFDSINNPQKSVHIRGSALSAAVDEGNQAAFPPLYIPRCFREIDSSSDIAYRRIWRWIKNDLPLHNCRGPPANPELPTRVLDVFASDGLVKLFESRGQRGRYTALSHSWGKSPRLTARRSNIEDLKCGIALSSLPKTFKDAIQITQRLQIRYIWIDCLCIVQDDPLDWEKEAQAMGELYRNSYITIAAANSIDSNTGCFPQRKDAPYLSSASQSLGYKTKVNVYGPGTCRFGVRPSNSQRQNLSNIYLSKEWLPGSCSATPQKTVIGSFGQKFDPLEDEPLSTRGWTLQERLLPSRIIHYAKDQMYYQCDCAVQSEDGFSFPNTFFSLRVLIQTQLLPFEQHGVGENSVSLIRGHLPVDKTRRWDGGWLGIVQNYSQRKLTVDQDKLPALSGLARMLAEETGDRYFAGLWASHLPEDLFWRVYLQEESFSSMLLIKGKALGKVTKPKQYRAPSWSWASLDAPIRFLPLTYKNLVASVVSCSTTPTHTDEYGRVKAGRLVIEAPIYEILPHTPENEWRKHGKPIEIRFPPDDKRELSVGELYLDFPDEPLPFACYALFLDPGNALVLRTRSGRPAIESDEIPGYDKLLKSEQDTVADQLVTTNTAVEQIKQRPEMKKWVFQSFRNAERIGIAIFVEGPKNEGKKGQKELNMSELTLEDVHMAKGGESWGPITSKDPKIRTTIL